MNVQKDSTGHAGAAMALLAKIEDRRGLITHAVKAKHLSKVLMFQLEESLNLDRATKTHEHCVSLTLSKYTIETALWLMGELYDAAVELAEQADALSDAATELAEALDD